MKAKNGKPSKDKNETAVAKTQGNNMVPDYIKQGSKRGSEEVEMEDIAIPRLDLVQALSPCRKKTDSAYIEGAEEGHMFNNVTRELFKGSVFVLPIIFKKEYLIWKDRKEGGGFRGAFENMDDAKETYTRLSTEGEKGLEIVDTAQHICFILDLEEDGAVLSVNEIAVTMSRSKMKVSRTWNSHIRILGGDRFSRIYKVSAVPDKSDKGEYFNFKVEPHGFPTEEIYKKAESVYTEIFKGSRKVEVNRDVDEAQADSPVDTESSEF
jgi:hypothetical protein